MEHKAAKKRASAREIYIYAGYKGCHFDRREKSAAAFSRSQQQISHPMKLGSK